MTEAEEAQEAIAGVSRFAQIAPVTSQMMSAIVVVAILGHQDWATGDLFIKIAELAIPPIIFSVANAKSHEEGLSKRII